MPTQVTSLGWVLYWASFVLAAQYLLRKGYRKLRLDLEARRRWRENYIPELHVGDVVSCAVLALLPLINSCIALFGIFSLLRGVLLGILSVLAIPLVPPLKRP